MKPLSLAVSCLLLGVCFGFAAGAVLVALVKGL